MARKQKISRYNGDEYWATLPSDELIPVLSEKVDDYRRYVRTSGLLQLWQRSYFMYYRSLNRGGALVKTGELGEFKTINVNHYRNLLQHILIMATSSRPAFQPRATNADSKSLGQAKLAKDLLDFYMREHHLENFLKQTAEYALIFGEGFLKTEWNVSGGDVYDTDDNGAPIYNGDLRFESFTPLEVIRDFTKIKAERNQWYVLETRRNKWDLIAKYAKFPGQPTEEQLAADPEAGERWAQLAANSENLKQEILAASTDSDNQDLDAFRFTWINGYDTDDIFVYEFYHEPTEALPQGRMIYYVSDEVILFDGPLPPPTKLPLERMVPSELTGTVFGHTPGYDLLPIQEALDNLNSIVLTNQETFGVQCITIPSGANIATAELRKGLNVITYDGNQPNKPEALNLTSTPGEIFNYMTILERTMETISGINSVARGNPETALKSGVALALVQSMAIQFNSQFQQSYAILCEGAGTRIIELLKGYAQVPHVVAIAGDANRYQVREFNAKDIAGVARVTVDMGNALTKTTAGKVELAENLTKLGLIKAPEQYITVMETGNLDPLIEGPFAENNLIRRENETLRNIQDYIQQNKLPPDYTVPVMVTDAHKQHIMEHRCVLNSPDARQDPTVIKATLLHLEEHIQALKSVDPALLSLLGETGLSQPPQAAMGAVPEVLAGGNPPQVQGPNFPTNPLTGQEWNPQTGGLQ